MNTEENKVDLTSVNKTKKQFKLPKLKNLFKKNSAGPGRDAEGKFTSGGGGLLSGKKLNLKRMLPVVLVVALVGGFLVFRSFASVTKPSEYQYSIADCKGNSGQAGEVVRCQDGSAEALVYRMQQAALGRQTDFGYKTWTQKLAGDRTSSEQVAREIESIQEVRWGSITNKDFVDKIAGFANASQRAGWVKELDQKKISRAQLATNIANLFKMSVNKVMTPAYKHNNQQYIGAIYTNLLKRQVASTRIRDAIPAAPANDYWVQQLNQEKMTRAQVLVAIAKSNEAKSATTGDIIKYVASKPALNIVQTAKAKQAARTKELAQLAVNSKNYYEKGALSNQVQASKLPVQASNQASPNAPSRAALTAIANIQKQAEGNKESAQKSSNTVQKNLSKAEAIFKDAKAASNFSRDIPSTTAESSRNQIAVYAAQSKNKVNDISRYISQIASSYKSAEAKYQAEQRRLAEEAAQRERERQQREQQQGGGSGGGTAAPPAGSGLNPAACRVSLGQINRGSGRDCIARLQQWGNISQDGIWGPNTQAVYDRMRSNPAPTDAATCSRTGGTWTNGRCVHSGGGPTDGGSGDNGGTNCGGNRVYYGGRCYTPVKIPYSKCNFSRGEWRTTCRDGDQTRDINGQTYIIKWQRVTVSWNFKVTRHEWNQGKLWTY